MMDGMFLNKCPTLVYLAALERKKEEKKREKMFPLISLELVSI